MKIELLYFDGCPSWQEGFENLKTVLEGEGLQAEIYLVNVEDGTSATAWKFLGSPSFQVNGKDFWPEERAAFHLSCRVYQTPNGMRGAPSVEMLREKLRSL
jgi:hypothetical protein